MGSAISLRSDDDGDGLRRLARQRRDTDRARRLSHKCCSDRQCDSSDRAQLAGTLNARGPDGLINETAPGRPSLLNEDQRTALAKSIERGPTPYLDGVVRWRLGDLAQWIWDGFRASMR